MFQSETGKFRKLRDHGDAVFGGDLVHRRSTIGYADYMFTLTECVIGWKMDLLDMLVLSTVEAEYMVAADALVKALLRWQELVRKFRQDSIRVLEDDTKRSLANMKMKAIMVEKFMTLLNFFHVLQQ